jgi:hypothetical protein
LKSIIGAGGHTQTTTDALVPVNPCDFVLQVNGMDVAAVQTELAACAEIFIANAVKFGSNDLRGWQLQLGDSPKAHATAPAAIANEHWTLRILR